MEWFVDFPSRVEKGSLLPHVPRQGTFTGCARMTAGEASIIHELDQVRSDSVVRIDIQLP